MITSNLSHNMFCFPVGEMQVTVQGFVSPETGRADVWTERVDVHFIYTKNEDIFELLLFCDAAKRKGTSLDRLYIPYVPFSRQDRCNNPGEAFSLKVFCDLINGLNFRTVVIQDPHSDVTPALLNHCIVENQWGLLAPLIRQYVKTPYYLVAPDAGALKKVHKLAQDLAFHDLRDARKQFLGVIESSKERDTRTGEITGTVVHASGLIRTVTKGDEDIPITYVIADDIIDGGRTFIELAKELRGMGAEKVHLYATHGFCTKGKQVFDGIIDEVHAVNDYSERFNAMR